MRARARVYPPYHACFLFAFLLSFVSAVFARGSARPILMTVCIPHTHPHRHLSHMFFFLFCCCRAHHAHPAIVPRRRPLAVYATHSTPLRMPLRPSSPLPSPSLSRPRTLCPPRPHDPPSTPISMYITHSASTYVTTRPSRPGFGPLAAPRVLLSLLLLIVFFWWWLVA